MAGASIAQKQFAQDNSDSRHHLLRSPSTSSDITVGSVTVSVPHANPRPLYVAQIPAGDLIYAEIERSVKVSNSAISLLNEFLDQVLYSIILAARSTSLPALKAVLPSVLKPRLGKQASRAAEEELKDYLDTDEAMSLHMKVNTAELRHDFDPDLAWRLARLRCMVYTRLGDMEEEDEEDWLEKEGLRSQLEMARQSMQASIEIGPASAIFVTSVLEYLGEQALYYAAQHAQKRHRQYGNQQIREEEADFVDLAADYDGLIVGGKDMNHVGRDSPLSRLWRSYRRNTRESGSRPMSPEIRNTRGLGLSHSRTPSTVPYEAAIIEEERSPDRIPLPIGGNDINEIEVPGLAPAFSEDEEEASDEDVLFKRRPASMIDMPGAFPGELTSNTLDVPEIPDRNPLRPIWMRKRSISSPQTGKKSPSRKGSTAKMEMIGQGGSSDAVEHSNGATVSRRAFSSGQQRPDSPDAVFGGAVAAVAGALGVGALGLSNREGHRSRQSAADRSLDAKETFHPPTAQPKKTVAEEMLGSVPLATPHKDANTGSSITNVGDFQSMHVPTTLSPGAYEDLTPRAENVNPLLNTKAMDDSRENLRPAPLRTMSGRVAISRPGTAENVRNIAPESSMGISETGSKSSNIDIHRLAASLPEHKSGPSHSAARDTAVPGTQELPKELTQPRHVKADSSGSANLPHSRNSSASSRLLGSVKDASTRLAVVSQQRVPGMANDEVRGTTSPSALNATRDTQPGTGHSSVSKRFHGKPLQLGDDSDEAKKKSLEILIRGNETLHYTLTPAAALRDDPTTTQKIRTPTHDMAEFIRNTGPRGEEQVNRTKPSGASIVSPEMPSSPTRIVQRIVSPSSPRGVVTPATPTRAKNPLGEPRDARADPTSSTRDLADYARSTGPSDVKQLPLPVRPSAEISTSPRSDTVTSRTEPSRQEPASPVTNRPASRLKFQARDARTSRQDDTSELIDFIREGPSSGREHRIDRKVAPFRTTMDSEDFDNLVAGRPVVSSAKGSEDGHHAASVDPSENSQTPLIVSNGKVGKSTMPAAVGREQSTDREGMPKRTRRRIKDPYAIYDSDDEDLDDEIGTKDSRNQEESLIDFLRNTSPPPSMRAQPILNVRPGSRTTEQLKAASAREESPHLTQSGSKIDKYRPTQPTHASHVDRNRATLSPTSVVSDRRNSSRPRFEARDPKATRANTSELAEYLKNSGPPPNAQYQPQPFILSITSTPQPSIPSKPQPKQEKGLFKRFSKTGK